MKLATAGIGGVVVGVLMSGMALAHHSFSMFDRSKVVVVQGTLKSVQLINPHSWFVITGPGPQGVVKDWSIEGPSPNILIRQGWKHTDVNAGDRVTLTFNPLKDGSPGGVLVSVRLPSGRELSGQPAGAPPPPPGGFSPGGAPPPGGPPPGALPPGAPQPPGASQ